MSCFSIPGGHLLLVVVCTGLAIGAEPANVVATDAVELTSTPTLTMQPNPLAPLTGLLEFSTDVATSAQLKARGPGEVLVIRTPYATDHSIPLLGLKPDSQYDLSVSLTSETGFSLELPNPFEISTAPLPDDFPEFEVVKTTPHRMEPGNTGTNV